MSDINVERSALESWINAEEACLNFIQDSTGFVIGDNLHLGDQIRLDRGNTVVFMISGDGADGPGSGVLGYQCPKPIQHWNAGAQLLGHFETRRDAQLFFGKLVNMMPPQKNKQSTSEIANRGLSPNVDLFELTEHPICETLIVDLDDDTEKQHWVLSMSFRVFYNNDKLQE